ncbi:MAG: DUF2946 family protein [Gammaproteobacteria bacterium]
MSRETATSTIPWPAFDEGVVKAMAKWPDVPRAFGWLSLDTRGAWRIQGETISHARARDFLARHYRCDDRGRWYVQNGPQQVFVDLDYTPWVYRLEPGGAFSTHTGLMTADLDAAALDDDGNLLLVTPLGVGVVDDRDLAAIEPLLDWEDSDEPRALRWLQRRHVLARVARAEVATRYGFEPRPRD